jgi:alpha-beta hydrolase superfamily lysophospholipase
MAFDHEILIAKTPEFDFDAAPEYGKPIQAYFRHYGLDFEKTLPGVIHRFGLIEAGNYQLATHYWQHPRARGTCFIVHGYLDHSGQFGKIIRQCLERQYSVVIFDLPGHGLSTGIPVSIHNFSEYQLALKAIIERFANEAPQPWQLISQSTGSSIAMDYVITEGVPSFQKVVLLNPLVRPANWSRTAFLQSVLKWFTPRVPRSFAANSHDVDYLRFVREDDPLQSRSIALSWIGALKLWLNRFELLPASAFDILIVQGEADETVDWRYNMDVIRKKFPQSHILRLRQGKHHMANEIAEIQQPMWAAIDLYFDSKLHDDDLQQLSDGRGE